MKSISVVLTTYNGEKYIAEQLESICTQTITPNEVLIFDDGSTDNTENICFSLARKYKKIKIVFTKNIINKGWQKNFIDGIKEASGEIVYLSDQDDIWLNDKIEKTISIFKNENINILATNYTIFNMRDSEPAELQQADTFVNDGALMKVQLTDKFYEVMRPGCTYCFRKSYFDQKVIQYWTENLAHDQLIWVTALLNSEMYILNEPLIYFRRHESNASGNVTLNTSLKRRIAQCKVMIQFTSNLLKNDNFSSSIKILLNNYLCYQKSRLDFFERKRVLKFIVKQLIYRKFIFSINSFFKDIFICFFNDK
ncbi:glycosyltransferase [Longibaculum muris]|uniref:glycosyltransferase n=1 Tax=Longibaculum muris TaxID=1796628 RepID=UPI0022E641C3|nr:glycosyltransferase [Longibaculum muris]